MKVPRISEKIDSCAAMIAGYARDYYQRLHANDRRWQDPEDMLQEGLKAAIETEDKYDPLRDWILTGSRKGAKFSSYLYQGLGYQLTKAVTIPLSQQKRRTWDLVELDAPIDGGTLLDRLPGSLPASDSVAQAVDGFLGLCRSLSPQAVLVLAEGLLAGNWPGGRRRREQDPSILAEIREASVNRNVTPEDLRVLSRSAEGREAALLGLSDLYSQGLAEKIENAGVERSGTKILECVRCRGRFSLDAIQRGHYLASTLTCRACYREMAGLPVEESCFAKQYSEEAVECRLHCPDRRICRTFNDRKEKKMKPDDSDIEELDVDDDAVAEPIVEKAPGKKKKAKSKAKSTAVDLSPPPKLELVKDREKPAAKKVAAKKKVKAKASKKTAPAKKKVKKAVAKKAAAKTTPTKKKAKKAESKKPKIPDIYPAPAELGGRWPFNAGTVMRYCFMRMYDGNGVKQDVLRAEVEKAGHGWPFMLKVMRNGGAFDRVRPTHTWKLDESDGRYRVYNVRTFIPAAGVKKPEALAKRKAS